jgi:predicted permease
MLFRFSQVEDEITAELADHFQRELERQRANGVPDADARRRAALRVGNLESIKEQTRDERGGRLAADLAGDLRVGWRGLRRNPAHTAAVALSIAIGVAGVTAIVSVVTAVLIRPLPYPSADSLYAVRVAWNDFTAPFSAADFLRLREHSSGVASVAAYWLNSEGFTLLGGALPEVVIGANVSAETPRVLGVPPALGRWLSEAPDSREALIGTSLWRDRFGMRADVLGQSLDLDGTVYTVVGVMPAGFNVPGQTDGQLWVSAPIREPARRGPYWLRVVARLEDGVGGEGAGARLTSALTPVLQDRYRVEPGWRYELTWLKEVIVGDVRATLLLFLLAVALVLVIASVNVASLMLARGTSRSRELSVRSALGARRSRLVRQLLAESSLVGVVSGIIGLAGAAALIRLLVIQAGPLIPRLHEVRLDAGAAALALGLAITVALISGTGPALWLTGPRLADAIKDGGRAASGGLRQGRIRRALVATEVALTLAVLIAATLLVKTMARLQAEDPGFRAEGLLSFRLVLPPDPYGERARLTRALGEIDERLRALPGVQAIAFAESLPPDQLQQSNNYTLAGEEPGTPGRTAQGSGVAQWNVVSPDFFPALGIDVLQGRGFTAADDERAPLVAVVSETFARKHFPRGDALGRRLKGGDWDPAAPWITIGGVVRDVPYASGVWGGNSPTLYIPLAQLPPSRWQFVVLQGAGVDRAVPAVAAAIRALDPRVPLRDVRVMAERLRASASTPRLRMLLFAALALIAVALAITGIYGVVAYDVNQRRRETAIRRALGASSSRVLAAVVRSGAQLTAAGVVAGLAVAWGIARSLTGFLYGVEAHDGWAFFAATVVLIAAALLAMVIPGAAAVRSDPLSVLREE